MLSAKQIDLKSLPQFRDGLSYIFIERGRIERNDSSIAWYGPEGAVALPVASLAALYLGPGSSITHAAVTVLSQNGVSIVWTGEGSVRFYASGLGKTRSASNIERQATAWADPVERVAIARRLYAFRFKEKLEDGLTLQQIRGKEGVRVRTAYARAAKKHGIIWKGRAYDRSDWRASDNVNRALSAGNTALYGICHSAIVTLGFSPALGFLHSGKQLSFVYDVADLYKSDYVVPEAFAAASKVTHDIERHMRILLRDRFKQERFLGRVVDDLYRLFELTETEDPYLIDEAKPGDIWDGDEEYVPGGVAYGRDES